MTIASPAPPSPHTALPTVVGVTLLVQALASMSAILPSAIAPELAAAHGVAGSLIGLQVSCIYIGAMMTSVIGGAVVRRYGALRCSQLALLLAATGGLLTAIPELVAVAFGAFFVGLGYGLTNPPSSHMLMKVTTATNRNLVFSIKQTGVPLGGVLAGLAGPPLALALGWQMALICGAGVALLVMVMISPFRDHWDHDRDRSAGLRSNPLRDAKIVWQNSGLRAISLAAFTFSAMQVAISTYTVTLLVSDMDFSLIAAGGVLAVLQVAGVGGRVLWGWLADRSRNPGAVLILITLVTCGAALAMALLSAATPAPLVYLIFGVMGLTAVGWNGVYLAEVARLAPPGLIGSATGSSMVVTYAGVMLGPAAIAGLYGLVGSYTLTFALFAIVPLTGLIFVVQARKAGQSKP
ncbi:MAG: MFS transporter [Rhodospirillales bacterium]|nr:MFS transporter [Rhodospirillales bacterium]